jgi:SAM-dependent methyltransferase
MTTTQDPDTLRAELHEAKVALQQLRTSPDKLQAEIVALEDIISKRLGKLPLPPEDLRLHVGAKPTASNFLLQGWASSRRVLLHFGETPPAPILDWGCGTGRTLRWLLEFPAWRDQYRGTDVDSSAIEWLRKNRIGNVQVCDGKAIALPYAAAEMAGVFSFSVLTHIHPQFFRAWFTEIARILRSGATAYLTFNGDRITESTEPQHAKAADEFRKQGWCWLEHKGHFKSAAFASHELVAEAASGIFKVARITRRDYQNMDALLATKI